MDCILEEDDGILYDPDEDIVNIINNSLDDNDIISSNSLINSNSCKPIIEKYYDGTVKEMTRKKNMTNLMIIVIKKKSIQ